MWESGSLPRYPKWEWPIFRIGGSLPLLPTLLLSMVIKLEPRNPVEMKKDAGERAALDALQEGWRHEQAFSVRDRVESIQ